MLAKANAIAALFNDAHIDTPFELPAHSAIGNEPCVQMHFEWKRGVYIEILVAASGVYLIKHTGLGFGKAHRCSNSHPHMVAELVIGISG